MPDRRLSWRRILRSAVAAAVCIGLLPAAALAAQPFTPTLTVSSSSYAAGAHPTITARIEKAEDYSEQRLQSASINFPRGLFSAVDPSNYCNLQLVGSDYSCANPNSKVGTAKIFAQLESDPGPPVVLIPIELDAIIYVEAPGSGEVAKLVTIPDSLASNITISSVKLNGTGDGLTVELNDLKTTVDIGGSTFNINIYRIDMTLDGTNAQAGDKPITFNPTFCDPANGFTATFTSYGDDGVKSGDDQTVPGSAAYPVTGCDAVPYGPSVSMALTNYNAGEQSAPNSSFTLPADNATTSSLKVSLPKDFLLNPASSVSTCASDQFSAGTCDASSQLGTVTTKTPLTPGDLVGAVYLGPPDGGRLKVGVFFPAPFSFRLDGFMEERADHGVDLTASMPPVPISSVSMSLDAGSTPLLLNPFKCDTFSAATTLSAHNGKSASFDSPLTITGCAAKARRVPDFDVSLSSRRPNHFANLRMRLRQDPGRISRARFLLPKGLRLVPGGKAPRVHQRAAYAEFWDENQHVHRATLRIDRKRGKQTYILASKNRQLRRLRMTLGGRRKRDTINFSGVPKGKLTDLTFTLFGRYSRLLRTGGARTASGCAPPLRFKAQVFDETKTPGVATKRLAASCPPKSSRSSR